MFFKKKCFYVTFGYKKCFSYIKRAFLQYIFDQIIWHNFSYDSAKKCVSFFTHTYKFFFQYFCNLTFSLFLANFIINRNKFLSLPVFKLIKITFNS